MRAPHSCRGLLPRSVRLVGLTLLLLAAAGCSRQPIPVSGTVTLDGKPVEGAKVTFHPLENDKEAKLAIGQTDKTGTFHLKTGGLDGAERRAYKVVILKDVLADPKLKMPDFPDNLEGRNQREDWLWRHFGDNRPPFKNALPDKYGDLKATPLTCKIPSQAPITFALTSK